jgi:ribosomal protein S18 acetylase RimI-like enzyme
MTEIIYKHVTAIQPQQLANVFKMSGIKRPFDDLHRLQRMIENADIMITAWNGSNLIGIARAITDFSYCCYLSDLAVNKQYQNMGIGKELVRLVRDKLSEEVTLILLASPGALEYYPHIGFDKIENGFKISRKY